MLRKLRTLLPLAFVWLVCATLGVTAQSSTTTPKRPWSVISRSSNHKLLAALLEENEFAQQLNKTGLTVFAPTDKVLQPVLDALGDVPRTGGLVKAILTHHVIPRVVLRRTTTTREPFTTLNPDNKIRRVSGPNSTTSAGSGLTYFRDGQGNLVTVNIRIINTVGSVLLPDKVLLPKDAFATIADAATYYNLTSLAGLLDDATVEQVNAIQPQKTLFAPLNSAFTAAGSLLETLLPEQVSQVLFYHLVADVIVVDFESSTVDTLLEGQTLQLVAPKSVRDTTTSRITVRTRNIWFRGGVIQIIDKVLVPSFEPPADTPPPAEMQLFWSPRAVASTSLAAPPLPLMGMLDMSSGAGALEVQGSGVPILLHGDTASP